MNVLMMVLIVLHVIPGVYWAGTTFALARDPMIGDAVLGRAQAGAAGVVIVMGIILMAIHYDLPAGAAQWDLGVGALCALIAAGVQHGIAWPARRRLAAGTGDKAANAQRAALGQRLAALLLVVTVIAMVIWRFM